MKKYFGLLWSMLVVVKAEYCGNLGEKEFYCEEGHCCGDFRCCTYYHYYEMWWFWLLMVILIILGCTCAYYKRHYAGPYSLMSNHWYAMIHRHRTQQQTTNQPEVYQFKLPSYEETIQMQQLGPPEDNEGAPPPYTELTEQNQEDNIGVNSQLLHDSSVRPTPPEYTSNIVPQSSYTSNIVPQSSYTSNIIPQSSV